MKKPYLILPILAALLLMFSCGDDDDDNDDGQDVDDDDDDLDDDADDDDADDDTDDDEQPGEGDVLNGWNSECLSNKDEDPYTRQESYLMDYADGILYVQHVNSCRNCEFGFEGSYEIDGDTLMITEYDVEPLAALCDCWYTVEYEVPNLEAGGIYQLNIYKVDDKEGFTGDPVLIMQNTLDLSQQSHFEFLLETYTCI